MPADINAKILGNKLRLDRIFFSPLLVDDEVDGHYRAAVRAFQEANGIEADGNVGPVTSATLGSYGPLLQYAVLEKQSFDELCKLPEDYLGKSLVPRLGYETILELEAEKYHTSQSFLRRLNPEINWDTVEAGTTVTVPLIRRRRPNFYVAKVEINIAQKCVRVWDENGKLRAFFNCSIGTDKKVYGGMLLAIANTAEWPTYTLRPELFHLEKEIRNKLLLPSGPNNPVGRAWIGLNRAGYGIHGTPDPDKIGLTESHGCIRLSNWDALSFSYMARVGAGVIFTGAPGGDGAGPSDGSPTSGAIPATSAPKAPPASSAVAP
ncbi:MAG: L,D-transpeptidase [Candidatus Sumerlaeota bacterium]|nr:L,D-transpeptidase [Candidatus Sumerlaeota bacterium]